MDFSKPAGCSFFLLQAKTLLGKESESRPCFSSDSFLVLFHQNSMLQAAKENGGPSGENPANPKADA